LRYLRHLFHRRARRRLLPLRDRRMRKHDPATDSDPL
jgi:hypothetical protein